MLWGTLVWETEKKQHFGFLASQLVILQNIILVMFRWSIREGISAGVSFGLKRRAFIFLDTYSFELDYLILCWVVVCTKMVVACFKPSFSVTTYQVSKFPSHLVFIIALCRQSCLPTWLAKFKLRCLLIKATLCSEWPWVFTWFVSEANWVFSIWHPFYLYMKS